METRGQPKLWDWALPKTAALVLLLWLVFAQTLVAARAASITFDEGPHLAVGYSTWRTGDLRLQPVHIHPPLANLIAAAPLLLNQDLPDPRSISGWEINSLSAITDAIVWQYPDPTRLALSGRLPIILLTLITAALVWRWATDLSGSTGGLLALALYALDPNIIAHGSLVTTDMAATALILLALFHLHRYLRRPSLPRLVGIGVAVGLALASKVSAVLLLPVIAGVLLRQGIDYTSRPLPHDRSWRKTALSIFTENFVVKFVVPFCGICSIAFVVLWALYGFELRALPDLGVSIPLPAATHIDIYRSLNEHYQLGHAAFLNGQINEQGWWYYFPLAFLLKTPIPVLLLLGGTLILALWRRKPTALALALFPIIYITSAFFSSVNIGYRHMLPILPLAYIFSGSALRPGVVRDPTSIKRYTRRLVLLGLLAWSALGMARVLPYPLSFFNELAGGPQNGFRWLVDSNLDWGQNLWQLRDWLESQRGDTVYYSHYSPARSEVYGLQVKRLPPHPQAVSFNPFDPAPGLYAIGATTLQGVYAPDINSFAYFRARQPETVLGNALFVYSVPDHVSPAWVAVCFGIPLSDQQIRTGYRQPNLRLVRFDCSQSQFFPTGKEGHVILPPTLAWPRNASLVLHARDALGNTVYTVLSVNDHPNPAVLSEVSSIDGPLSFLGYQLEQTQPRPGEEIILTTFWQVKWVPSRPLSLMAHVLGPGDVPVAVGDGLGVPVEAWQPGDCIIQIHPLTLPPESTADGYRIQTGAYWLDTLERWPITMPDGTIGDRILLDKINILD